MENFHTVTVLIFPEAFDLEIRETIPCLKCIMS